MLEPAANELAGPEREDSVFTVAGISTTQANAPLPVVAAEAALAEGTLIDVSGQVADGLFASSDSLEVDVPVDVAELWAPMLVQSGMLGAQLGEETPAVAACQGRMREQEVGMPGAHSGASIRSPKRN